MITIDDKIYDSVITAKQWHRGRKVLSVSVTTKTLLVLYNAANVSITAKKTATRSLNQSRE